MTIQGRHASVFAVLVCAVTLCLAANVAAQRTFHAVLDGAQQVPPVTSTTGVGTGTVTLNSAETQVNITLSFSGLSSNQTDSHIHGPGARGSNAGVTIPIGVF